MKRRVGVCPTCGNQVGVTVRGIVVTHRGNFNSGREGCPGSGKPERADDVAGDHEWRDCSMCPGGACLLFGQPRPDEETCACRHPVYCHRAGESS